MRRFTCAIQLTVTFKDDVLDESDVEDAVSSALRRLKPTDLVFDSIEEVDIDDGELEDPDAVEYVEDGEEDTDE